MFKLKFGIIWTVFVTAIFAMCIFIPGEQRGGADLDLPLTLFFLLFEAIGIYMLYSGAKTVIADKKTDKYGNMIYGKILNISSTGSYENGNAEYQAEIIAYIPEENNTRTFKEIIGFDFNKYQVGSYLLLKHFENDVNILLEVEKSKVPIKTLEAIGDDGYDNNNSNLDFDNVWNQDYPINDYSEVSQKQYNQEYTNAPDAVSNNYYQKFNQQTSKLSAIYFIVFGTIWNLFILVFFYLPKYLPDTGNGSYYINGNPVSREEFFTISNVLPFLIFGMIIIVIGIINLFKKENK